MFLSGKELWSGVVWKIDTEKVNKERKYKYIKEILDLEPLLDKESLELADWASRYYHHPLGEVISYFFPPSLRKGKEAKFLEAKFFELTNKGEFFDLAELSRAPIQRKALELFRSKKEFSQISAKAYWNIKFSLECFINQRFNLKIHKRVISV